MNLVTKKKNKIIYAASEKSRGGGVEENFWIVWLESIFAVDFSEMPSGVGQRAWGKFMPHPLQ